MWLRIYNQVKCKPPLSDKELQGIVKSIARRERTQRGFRSPEEVVEIKRIMKDYGLSYANAEIMWKGLH